VDSNGHRLVGSAWRKLGLTFGAVARLAVVVSLAGAMTAAQARDQRDPKPAVELGTVSLAEMPPEARQTERLIRSGGPFPYGKDGVVFGNRERMLPRQPRGFYHEYTVRSPGSRDRGARRIVCGGTVAREPVACFFTEDHYASFRRIVQ
jgi:ribonuclease T1